MGREGERENEPTKANTRLGRLVRDETRTQPLKQQAVSWWWWIGREGQRARRSRYTTRKTHECKEQTTGSDGEGQQKGLA